jgi:hypothetical protein
MSLILVGTIRWLFIAKIKQFQAREVRLQLLHQPNPSILPQGEINLKANLFLLISESFIISSPTQKPKDRSTILPAALHGVKLSH